MDNIEKNLSELRNHIRRMNYIIQAEGLINWDMQTGIPEKAIPGRVEVIGYLYGCLLYTSRCV